MSQQSRSTRPVGEPWATRWYTPLVVITLGLLALMIVALAIVEVLVASAPEPVAPGAWTTPLERAERALAEGDVADAMAWWREARGLALRSGQWDAMLDVGDASRRLGARDGFGRDADALARDAYRTALFRARGAHSLPGVLRAADAFGRLGDREVVAQALQMAAAQAGRDPFALAQVRTVADRWMTARETAHQIPGGQP